MKTYTVIFYGCKPHEVEANTHEMAYSGLCCWHTDKRAAVIENATGKAVFMRHVNDKHGNYIKTEYLNGFAEV